MFPECAAGLYMMMKVKFHDAEIPYVKQQTAQEKQLEYQYKADKKEQKAEYEKSRLPESGYMLRSEYEERSKSIDKNKVEIKPAQTPTEAGMKYVPVPKYKLVKYNSSPGFTELEIPRRLNFDREVTGQGIVASNFKFMVYPAIHYYASADCTTTDLYVIPLDEKLTELERVKRANIIRRETNPILSTDKDVDTPYIFRSLTPVDFTTDNKKLLIKEKTGYRFDGIWKTDIWVYDFDTKKATKLPEIRDAIIHYWANAKGVNLDERRWDIYPMGFEEGDNNRIVVCAYAYTGKNPVFLGSWSIDAQGNSSSLKALDGSKMSISIVGYKLEYDGNETREFVEEEVKAAEEKDKAAKKDAKKAEKERLKKLEQEYKKKTYENDEKYLNNQYSPQKHEYVPPSQMKQKKEEPENSSKIMNAQAREDYEYNYYNRYDASQREEDYYNNQEYERSYNNSNQQSYQEPQTRNQSFGSYDTYRERRLKYYEGSQNTGTEY